MLIDHLADDEPFHKGCRTEADCHDYQDKNPPLAAPKQALVVYPKVAAVGTLSGVGSDDSPARLLGSPATVAQVLEAVALPEAAEALAQDRVRVG